MGAAAAQQRQLGSVSHALTAHETNALRVAYILIQAGHCRQALARSVVNGRDIEEESALGLLSVHHDCYSVTGALFRACNGKLRSFLQCYEFLRSRLPHEFASIDALNDNETKQELLAWLDCCIDMAGL